ncbi:MAG: RusA family crossover junction endodeoxyribonuclease [Pantoea sp.]|nr:RusA family crossover junction endodeoxyribonuclease [Pantoea sp.]
MKLILPFPPSVNGYWRATNKGMKISASGRCFRANAIAAVYEQLRCRPKPLTQPVEVKVVLYPPNRGRRDLDNFQKALFDSLTHAGVWVDDSQIKRFSVEWGTVTCHGKSEVTISPFNAVAETSSLIQGQ